MIWFFFANLKIAQSLINELHTKYLSILPRSHEPVELTRFERIIKTEVVKLDKNNNQDIYLALNEDIGKNTKNDYLARFKHKINLSTNATEDKPDKNKSYITIPRIDVSNTFIFARKNWLIVFKVSFLLLL
jgi:hypothetical protein